MSRRVVLVVLDGVGAGALPDAGAYRDEGAHTLLHTMQAAAPRLPVLSSLGLLSLPGLEAFAPARAPFGAYGTLAEDAPGKDTTTGHWALCGLPLKTPFPVFPDGFPQAFMQKLQDAIGRGTLGNRAASGTAILEELGPQHQASGRPIVYTSADSVLQIAAHEDTIPPEELYGICRAARALLTGELAVARVIARPFAGAAGRYVRTGNRRDFSLPPPGETMLDRMKAAGQRVVGIGKIEDIFCGQGLTDALHVAGNEACQQVTLEAVGQDFGGLIFTNLVDFDMLYGHRRDPAGMARALEDTDTWLCALMRRLKPQDLLLVTADHGCDPVHAGTDHTREAVPLLAWAPFVAPGPIAGGVMSDVSATALAYLGLAPLLGAPLLPLP